MKKDSAFVFYIVVFCACALVARVVDQTYGIVWDRTDVANASMVRANHMGATLLHGAVGGIMVGLAWLAAAFVRSRSL